MAKIDMTFDVGGGGTDITSDNQWTLFESGSVPCNVGDYFLINCATSYDAVFTFTGANIIAYHSDLSSPKIGYTALIKATSTSWSCSRGIYYCKIQIS